VTGGRHSDRRMGELGNAPACPPSCRLTRPAPETEILPAQPLAVSRQFHRRASESSNGIDETSAQSKALIIRASICIYNVSTFDRRRSTSPCKAPSRGGAIVSRYVYRNE